MQPQLNTKTTHQREEIDIVELLSFYFTKWRYFAIAIIACLVLSVVYLKLATPQYQVTGAILLRSDDKNNLESKLSQLGDFGLSFGQKQADDEIYVIKSERLMGEMVKHLGLQTQYFLKKGLKYQEQYPVSPITVTIPSSLQDSLLGTIEMIITKERDTYAVKAEYKNEYFSCIIHQINGTYMTSWGSFCFHENRPLKDGDKLKIQFIPLSNSSVTKH